MAGQWGMLFALMAVLPFVSSDTIPTEFASLNAQTGGVYLAGKSYTGTIPSEFGILTEVTQFQMRNNDLTGRIPTEFGYLTKMKQNLYLDNNQLMGDIPTQFGHLTEFTTQFMFDENDLDGTIPTELGRLVKMTTQFDV